MLVHHVRGTAAHGEVVDARSGREVIEGDVVGAIERHIGHVARRIGNDIAYIFHSPWERGEEAKALPSLTIVLIHLESLLDDEHARCARVRGGAEDEQEEGEGEEPRLLHVISALCDPLYREKGGKKVQIKE